MQYRKTQASLSVELAWAKMVTRLAAKEIVKWKCKATNPEKQSEVAPWVVGRPFVNFKKRDIFGREVDATNEVGRRGIWREVAIKFTDKISCDTN